MPETKDSGQKRELTVRLVGVRARTSMNDLLSALQRLLPRQPTEKIRTAMGNLPWTLTRSASVDQAKKIKQFLESRGAVLRITYTQAGGRSSIPPQPQKLVGEQGDPSSMKASVKTEPHAFQGVDRRLKPRIHPGILLQPMGIGDILDRSFYLLQGHFLLFFLIILIPQGAFFLVSKGLQFFLPAQMAQNPTLAMGIGLGISSFLAMIVFFIVQFWAQGALIHAVSETYLGHHTSLGSAYGAIRHRLGRLLGTIFLMGVLMILAPALVGISMAVLFPLLKHMGMSGWPMGLLGAFMGFLAVALFFELFMNWLMADKVVVLEDKAWWSALRRSKELMKSRTEPGFWKRSKMKAALILLLGFLVGIGIHLFLQIPGLLLRFFMPQSPFAATLQQILNMGATSLATVYTAIAMILFYYDIRLRREGFDLRMMAENL